MVVDQWEDAAQAGTAPGRSKDFAEYSSSSGVADDDDDDDDVDDDVLVIVRPGS